jgi:hypothetical protein
MESQDIVQNLIDTLGQSQRRRFPPALAQNYIEIDERDDARLLAHLKRLAAHVRFYPEDGGAPGDWQDFFPFEADEVREWIDALGADTRPQLALLLAFFEVYRQPQALLNGLTARHLDFFYRDVLRLESRPAVPDRAHLLLGLKKNTQPVKIGPAHQFSAGKDATGVERIYRPRRDTVINQASIARLGSIYVDPAGPGVVRHAPIANSSDGLGGELDSQEPRWRGFGHAGLPVAETGFALSAPVLRMREGRRDIGVELTLAAVNPALESVEDFGKVFQVYLSGESSWISKTPLNATLADSKLVFDISLADSDEAVVDYDPDIHGYNFEAQAPVMQVFLNTDETATIGYWSFSGVRIRKARLSVQVRDVQSLELENDAGKLKADKAFLPFGSQPVRGSRFLVGYAEALGKKLSELKLRIQWKDAPSNFATHYSGYKTSVTNGTFGAGVTFNDAGSLLASNVSKNLFDGSNATTPHEIVFSTQPDLAPPAPQGSAQMVYALSSIGSTWAQGSLAAALLQSPVLFTAANIKPEPRPGFITLSLNAGFLHKSYRKEQVEYLMNYAKFGEGMPTMLNEPYTPEIASLKLSYKAFSDQVSIESDSNVDIESELESSFASNDLQFYHLGYFGQMREHGVQRRLFDFVVDKQVTLLPRYRGRGELLLAIENLDPGDGISILFQVAEGSANPALARENIEWSVLCDNYWKQLGVRELVADSTNQLLTSGLIRFVIPREATTTNTLLPCGYIWLRASIAGNVDAVCQLLEVAANAIEVEFEDRGNDPLHLAGALLAGSIARLKTAVAAVKSVNQPYASFGGKLPEADEHYRTRVAERLRHKDRALSAWDIERLVLDHFPRIHKVKCIPHASPESWLAPGNTMLVLVPDLRNKNAINPLEPRVDSDTLARVRALLRTRGCMQAVYHAKNPSYQRIRLEFTVRFRSGYEFNYYREQLNAALLEFLSPWAYQSGRDISFGGRVYKSQLLDFVEEIEYVDFVTDFRLYSYVDSPLNLADTAEVTPLAPDVILVSDATHQINEYSQD